MKAVQAEELESSLLVRGYERRQRGRSSYHRRGGAVILLILLGGLGPSFAFSGDTTGETLAQLPVTRTSGAGELAIAL